MSTQANWSIPTDAVPQGTYARLVSEQTRLAQRLDGAARRVLLIGGSGYIGLPVADHLLALGYEVVNLDRLVYRHGSATVGLVGRDGYRFVDGDMADAKALENSLLGVTDVVVLGGLVGDPITKKFPNESAAINDAAVKSCIDSLSGRGLERVIFVSTCSNYGLIPETAKADEGFELSPLSLYAKSKVAAEQHILAKQGRVDYAPTVLRFATAFGLAPRMRFDLTVNEFARELSLDRELVVFDAHTWRPYCHVKDFARLISRVLAFPREDVAFEVFNAGGDANNHTKQSIVDLVLARLPGRRVAYRSDSGDPRNYRVDFAKVRTKLHFEPSMSVADGIGEIVDAIEAGLLDDVDERMNFYGNYALPGLKAR
jgi:nucleoside-diphosphate-sugar epimerase